MSTQTRQYRQLTQGQRYQIKALLGIGCMQKKMAMLVGISESALSRELSRNASDDGYCAENVQILATQRRVTAKKFSKTDERHIPIIKKGLLLGWSPENIRCRMKSEVADIALSHTTVYKRVAANKAHGESLYKNLPRFGKKRCKGGNRKAERTMIPKRIDISDRSEVVDLRSRLGDWEGDTVYGQDAYLVTLMERKSRLTLIGKVDTKHAEIIANSMIEHRNVCHRFTQSHWIMVVSLQPMKRWQKRSMQISTLPSLMPVIGGKPTKIPMA